MVIAYINVNSLLHHIDEICRLVQYHEIHILVMNETKIDDKIDDNLVSIDGHQIKRNDRNCNGGCISEYVKDSSFDDITVRADLPLSDLEGLCN